MSPESKLMKILAALFLAMLTVMAAKADPQGSRGHFRRAPAFRPPSAGTHFVARSGNGFQRHFHYGDGGVVIFDPFGYGDNDDLPSDDTVYQGQVAPQNAGNLPYAAPTSDPDIVISPYEPHATISVAGIPHGAIVEDPVANQVFLNP
jgi:hypothetical protein